MTQISEFNTVLNQVLTLTEATTSECALLPLERVLSDSAARANRSRCIRSLAFSWRLIGGSSERRLRVVRYPVAGQNAEERLGSESSSRKQRTLER